MYSMSPNLLPFRMDFILGNMKKSGGDKSKEERDSELFVARLFRI
jgi:hypothetical protein